MRVVFLLFLFSSVFVNAQDISRNLGDFEKVKVVSGLDITIEKSDSNKVIISGDLKEDVSVKNKDGRLRISMNVSSVLKDHNVKVRLFVQNDLKLIDLSEGSDAKIIGKLEQDFLEVKTQEGSEFEGILYCTHSDFRAVTGGVIAVNGQVDQIDVNVGTGGVFKGMDLDAKSAHVESSTGGVIEVSAIEVLDAEVKVGGSVYYKGLPKVLNTKKVLGGTISAKN
ncbi:MAG: head GIN domain-containing protein [Flavobacteriaceae bacterium]